MKSLLATLLLLAATTAHSREVTQDCRSFDRPVSGKYCITTTVGSTSPDILYVLHGKNEDENAWHEIPGMIDIADRWEAMGVQAPRVVTISFGGVWLLTDHDGDGNPGLLPHLADEILPMIERELGGLNGRRLLMGDSMGGLNASELYLKRGHLFSKVVLACPAITTVSPYSSLIKIFRYMSRTHANFFKVLEMLILGRIYFPTKDDWNAAAPLSLAQSELDSTSPSLHVSIGSEDEYGFFEGARTFAEIAASRGVPTSFKLVPGPHCSFDPETIAPFLAN